MEKKLAHYNLELIKTLIKQNRYFVTASARKAYTELGIEDKEAIEIILNLTARDLYKSMTSYMDSTIWQDVYHGQLKEIKLYIKLQVKEEAIVISFKEK